ncbi:7564_t:CDS:2 [Cetraspora pellucida]|uniref:7564_t:CDS:1 n=1 Tax=Cetraspora pellucida TaxID=1433469 RepID=A0ACA9NH70_9GLOM|nr:7564_t:CDS:2 [Cetraspora pellucida]
MSNQKSYITHQEIEGLETIEEVNEIPNLLKHYLFGIHEILSGRKEKINREADNRNLEEVDPKDMAEA